MVTEGELPYHCDCLAPAIRKQLLGAHRSKENWYEGPQLPNNQPLVCSSKENELINGLF